MDSQKYIIIAKVDDFKDIPIRSYSLFGKKIGVIKKDDGSFYAIDVTCKHQGADLTSATVEDYIATCHCHQWKYNLLTGECLTHNSPALRKYAIVVEKGIIKIALTPLEE